MKRIAKHNTRLVISCLGILYLMHFFSINALVASTGSLNATSHGDYLVYKAENKKAPKKDRKSPYSLLITKHMVTSPLRVIHTLEESPAINYSVELLKIQHTESTGLRSHILCTLPDDAYKRFRFFCSYLI